MKKTYLATAVATLFVSSITTVIAAETLLDDKVVSVSRSEQRSFDEPATVQSISSEVISGSGPQINISESLNRLPGVVALNRQNYGQDLQISIRGFGARAKFGVRGVRLITDGIPATIPDGQGQSGTISLTSLDRIEVLTGPLAQLYGNAAGGVIQTFTREAPDAPEFLVQGFYGSYGMARTDWQYAQKVGQFGLVADYATFKTDGFRQNSQAERNQFNGKFTYDHDDKTRLSFIANVLDQPYGHDSAGLSTIAEVMSTPTLAGTDKYPYASKTINQNQIGNVLSHKFDQNNIINFRVYTGNRKQEAISGVNISNKTSWSTLDRDYVGVGVDYIAKTTVNALPVNYMIGFNYDESEEINRSGSSTGVNVIGGGVTRNEKRLAKNTDFYGQGSLYLTEKLSVLMGARATSVELSSRNISSNNSLLGSVTFNSINPVLGFTYHLFDNLNIYSNYGRGFETPTLVEIGYENDPGDSAAVISSFNKSLKASKSQHYEAGMKWMPSPKSRINLSLFYIKTSDEIMSDVNDTTSTTASPTKGTSYVNAGGTIRRGIELASVAYIGSNFKSDVSISFMEAYFDSTFTYNGTDPKTVSFGNRIPGVPKSTLFTDLVWSSTDFSRNKYKQIMGSQLALEWLASGDMYAAFDNSAKAGSRAPGYGVANLRLTHRVDIEKFTLTGYGQLYNLFDKRYVGSLIVGDSAPFEPAPGRNWVVGLNAITRF